MSQSSQAFKVIRKAPELIAPAKPTPRELKLLSDIDDQEGLRFHIPVINIYKKSELGRGKDPVNVIKEALANALVYYYPFAGRLKELGTNRKLAVDCTGEGVMFIEADAPDVTVDDFGDVIQPPFSSLDELLFDVPGANAIVGGPLLLIQVTRLGCGGFVMATRLNHAMCDALGLIQFFTAVSEMARGLPHLSVQPVWRREILTARIPPQVTHVHHEYDHVSGDLVPFDDMVHRSFFFGKEDVKFLRRFVPPHLYPCSTYEVLAAVFWRIRTIALKFDPNEEIRLLTVSNARSKFNPPIPKGYYGNVIAFSAAFTTAGKLSASPIGFAVELVKKAKNDLTEEYMKSMMDYLVLNNRPNIAIIGSFLISDVRRAGFEDLDFGWGKAFYGGNAKGGVGTTPGVASFLLQSFNKKGESGISIPVCLPAKAMEVFVEELDRLFQVDSVSYEKQINRSTPLITSSL